MAAVEQALNSIGLTVADHTSNGTLACPSVLMRISDIGGAPLCASAASLCRAAWKGDPDCFDGRIVEGTAKFLTVHPDIDREAFARKLSKTRCASIIAQARALKDAGAKSTFGRSLPALVAHELRELYNWRRTSGRLGDDA